MVLPTLDLSKFAKGTTYERRQLSSQLLHSLTLHGFVKLKGHGISRETIEDLLQWVSLARKNPFDGFSSLTDKIITEQVLL